MARNEDQTRFELIDPVLIDQRGWSRADIRVEETSCAVDIVHGEGRRRPKGRADYVLRRPLLPGTEPIPLGIIEAKREGLPPEHGLQQGIGYRVGHLHHVPFVFSSNGHLFVEYDEATGQTSEARPLTEFPTPEELISRYLAARALPADAALLKPLITSYKLGRGFLRYYQDASIRAAIEKIIRDRQAGIAPRVLLSLATGAGKTRIAAALLRRLFDAGMFGRALFVCDRTELRDNGLGDFQEAFGTDAAEVSTRNAQTNARVLIATYQTLDKKPPGKQPKGEEDSRSFFLKNYPPGYFDIIVIDECHRSAWGDWFMVLENNPKGIHVGLTATPREIQWPENPREDIQAEAKKEKQRLADNFEYFGTPVYEYSYQQGRDDGYLAPAEIETYDLYHDAHEQPERVRGVKRRDLVDKRLTDLHTGQNVPPEVVAENNSPTRIEETIILPERVEEMSAHLFGRLLATGKGDPHQKTIIFCASDAHADLVAIQLNNLYAKWCREQGQRRHNHFAFKCMSSTNGQALIPDFRSRSRARYIATTKDLLTTGVNVPCVRNIVFFRYVQSSILFHQMIGRGTRISEGDGKLMFRIFDYTGATALFGADFLTPPPPVGPDEPPIDPPPQPPRPPKVKARGTRITVADTGHFMVMGVDGRLARVTPQQYQARLIEELTATVPTLADFRARWLSEPERKAMMKQLTDRGLMPELLRDAADMGAYDMFDVLAALAYDVTPLTRAERAAHFNTREHPWLIHLPQPTAKVIKAIVKQFEKAGTESLETKELWQAPEVKKEHGLEALKQGGNVADLMRRTKEDLFVA